MDLIFASKNHLMTPVTNSQGDAFYDIKTSTPAGRLVPVTRIQRLEAAPTTSSRGRRGSVPIKGQVSDIQWQGLGTPAIIHSYLLERNSGEGIPVRRFLKRRNPLSLSKRCQFFVGNDGLRYRWKTIVGLGCLLSRDGQEVARSTRKLISEGVFAGRTKYVLHIEPECSTLDIGLIILTFLIVDYKRHQMENGPLSWGNAHDEDPGEGDGESAEGGHGVEG